MIYARGFQSSQTDIDILQNAALPESFHVLAMFLSVGRCIADRHCVIVSNRSR